MQLLRAPHVSFSAALTAQVEALGDDEAMKNRLCTPVPFPRTVAEYPRMMAGDLSNQLLWNQDVGLRQWIRDCRFDHFARAYFGDDDAAAQTTAT